MGTFGDIVGGLFQPIVSGLGIAADWYQQNKQFKYDKELQETIFEREDNATVRRATDLQNAGLSKTLAAGNAAGVGQAIRAQVPGAGLGNRGAEAIMLNSALMKQKADITKTYEEGELTKLQKERAAFELMPLKNLMAKTQSKEFSFDPDSGTLKNNGAAWSENPVLDMLSTMMFDEKYRAWQSSRWDPLLADMTKEIMTNNQWISESNREKAAWDIGLTKSFGVRSSDKVDAIWEAIVRQSGLDTKEGAPYASAAKQVLGKLFNVLGGVIK